MNLGGLCSFGRLLFQLCTEYPVPESAGHAKAILIVGIVVLHVVFFELTIPSWESVWF